MSTFQLTKDQILELASTNSAASQLLNQYLPEAFAPTVGDHVPVDVENAVDLSTLIVRNNSGNKQLLLANNKFLGSVNQSPMYVYTNKAIIVDSAYKPSIEVVNGRDLIVFEKK
jgi:hypothetical protein